MTKLKFLKCISVAYGYGEQQRVKRVEPINTIIAWCGYNHVEKPLERAIYAAYKVARFEKFKKEPQV